jgi:E3 ubiquitin-protein ligase UHRF1
MARNSKLLNEVMGRINKENATPKQTAERRKSAPNKRIARPKKRVDPVSDGELEESRPTKRARPETKPETPQLGLRRSTRNAGKTPPDYQAESQTHLPRLVTTKIGADHDRDPNRRSGKRIHDPYVGCNYLGRFVLTLHVTQ